MDENILYNKYQDYYVLWLNSIMGIGYGKISRLLVEFGSPKGVYDATEDELCACVTRTDKAGGDKLQELFFASENIRHGNISGRRFLKKEDVCSILKSRSDEGIWNQYKELGRKGIMMTYPGKEDYPESLNQAHNPPHILFYKGRLPDMSKPRVAIVGTRRCSNYGRTVAARLGEGLARAGIQVVSGMALGVDSYAQQAAVDAGGSSFAVLGSGVDVCYPAGGINLYMALQEKGGVISEYLPGTVAFAGNFPARNRIISTFSQVVVVVEAKRKSGSLITATLALEQGRDVMAVPGRVGEELSEGCNDLLRQGAHICTDVADIVELLGLALPESCLNMGVCARIGNNVLAREQEMVYGNICLIPKSLDSIIEETGMDGGRVINLLVELELLGVIQEVGKNYYVRSI